METTKINKGEKRNVVGTSKWMLVSLCLMTVHIAAGYKQYVCNRGL